MLEFMKKELEIYKKFIVHAWRHRVVKFFKKHKILRIITYVFLVIVGLLVLIMIVYRPAVNHKFERLGSSFSVKYAKELGLDWQDAYMALLVDIDVPMVRLMSYWDLHEPQNNNYEFEDLDWQFDQALANDAKVSLAMGLRQPRWPECHSPSWADELSQDVWQNELIQFMAVVVNRYKDHPALESYQLENEALNHWFGICNVHDRKIIRERLVEEYEMVKAIDPDHPIIMSLSDQHGIPIGEPTPDIYGYSVYRVVYNTQLFPGYLTYPTPVWYHRMRAGIIGLIKDRPIVIHELQLEPWGPVATVDLPVDEQNKSMSPKQMYRNVDFARQIGLDDAYLWGAEWWYWRMVAFDDPTIWEAAKDIVNQVNTGQAFQKKL